MSLARFPLVQVLITESEEERRVASAEARGEREALALVSIPSFLSTRA